MNDYTRMDKIHKEFIVYERPEGKWSLLKGVFIRNKKKVEALKEMSFTINKDELVGVIGPNGARKSTTVKVTSGILTPDSGSCLIDGRVPWKNRIEHIPKRWAWPRACVLSGSLRQELCDDRIF